MDKGLDFSAVKYCDGGDEGIQRLDQPSGGGDFSVQNLEMFDPIQADEVFEIEIRPGIDPMSVLRYLRFDGPDSPDFSAAEAYEYPVDWLYDFEFEPFNGVIMRLAILRQGRTTWQIVGLSGPTGIVLVPYSAEDAHWPPARYFSNRVLGEYSYHTEGPGPVSWDGSGALLDLGDWLITAYGGDTSESFSDEIYARPKSLETAFVEWLSASPAFSIFVLINVKCRWSDQSLSGRFNDAIVKVSEIDSAISIETDLTDAELAKVIEIIKQRGGEIAELVELLESDSHQLAEKLVSVVEAAHRDGKIAALLFGEWFMTSLRTASN